MHCRHRRRTETPSSDYFDSLAQDHDEIWPQTNVARAKKTGALEICVRHQAQSAPDLS
jgi:hypothetical protein